MVKNKRIGVISLGCDKNRVDTEKMLALLNKRHKLTQDISSAQIIIVNTCAFLQSSRKESLEEIFSSYQYKKSGNLEKIIVTGCLSQRFINDIYEELVEVDAFLGISDYGRILDVIDALYEGKDKIKCVGEPKNEDLFERILTTDNYAYLKIADGCYNHCTYCLIPYIRGRYRSVPMDKLLAEVKAMGKVNELILVAQDVTRYGEDLLPKTSIVQLIRELSKLKNVNGIRLLYCYPECITDELIHELKTNAKMIRYLDIPMQHADDTVLKRMGRRGTRQSYLDLIDKLKKEVKGIAIRSTFIAGFPGETEEQFENLLEFIKQAKLFNCGFFKYSREYGTPAYNLDGQIPYKTKERRVRKLYSVQKKIVRENLKALRGAVFNVTCEGFDDNNIIYYGRAYFNAPEIDGKVYFFSGEKEIEKGKTYQVKILKSSGYDLYGEVL